MESSAAKSLESQASSVYSFPVSNDVDDKVLAASFRECSIDETSRELIEFEKQYAELRRLKDEDISFFLSKLNSLATSAPFSEVAVHSSDEYQDSDDDEFLEEEKACLSMCLLIRDSSHAIVEAFEKRNEDDRANHMTLQSITNHIEQEKQGLINDIKELTAANNEQLYSLRKGPTGKVNFMDSKVNTLKNVAQKEFNLNSRYIDPTSAKQKDMCILKKEYLELDNEKAILSKSIHEHLRKRNDYQRLFREMKEEKRKLAQERRIQSRSLELRELDARQKSTHLEDANSKLDEVCRTLANTISATKENLALFQRNIEEISKGEDKDFSRDSISEAYMALY
ncbi:laminin subunit alpha-5-like protein [Perkinsela sp. CCAP 1560/4]|nr:laminin subunit alpha-5-like protein [Perkinsela sp. CCAP 1560/4]|eukprot:KNH09430.1 laminin subunit alpha-5-like protein [Perkinsela sp. CCAP 1560/4]